MKINIQEVIYSLEADQIKKFDPNATEAILAIKKLAEDEFDHCKQIIAVYTSYLKNTSEEIIQNYNPVQIAEKKAESLVNEEESNTGADGFLQKMNSDIELRKEVMNSIARIKSRSVSEIIQLASKHGFSFTVQEFRKACKNVFNELDDDLDKEAFIRIFPL